MFISDLQFFLNFSRAIGGETKFHAGSSISSRRSSQRFMAIGQTSLPQLKSLLPELFVPFPILDLVCPDRIEHCRSNFFHRLYFGMRRQATSRRISLLPRS